MSANLRLVRENSVAERDPRDLAIERAEELLAKQAEHDALWWGGPKGEGVLTTIRHMGETTASSISELKDTVAQLATTVAVLAGRVTGEDGIAIQLRDLKQELKSLTAERKAEAAELAAQQQQLHEDNKARIDRLWTVGMWVVTIAVGPTGVGVVVLVIRAFYVMQHGVVLAH